MIGNTFKIKQSKYLKETAKAYCFKASSKDSFAAISIPKSQILKYETTTTNNPFTNEDEEWIEITVTQWLWLKSELENKLKHYKFSADAVIENETHFGINWDFVIMKKRNKKNCFFCHGKLQETVRTQDHLIPRMILKAYGYKGGIANNTVPCCLDCNKEKSSLHPEVYRELVRRKISETGDPKYRIILFTLNKILL